MRPVLTIITAASFAALAAACGAGSGSGSGMADANSACNDAGSPPTFCGKGLDSNPNTGSAPTGTGTTVVAWRMTQDGTNVTGTVTTQSTDAPGTCASCHRSRTGTLSGTITGTTLSWTASFPADAAKDPTPQCLATLTGTISDITADSVSGTYSGNDVCEGAYSSGTLTMARTPAPAPPSPGM